MAGWMVAGGGGRLNFWMDGGFGWWAVRRFSVGCEAVGDLSDPSAPSDLSDLSDLYLARSLY